MRTAIVSAAIAAAVAVILLLGAGDPGGPNAFVIIGLRNGAIYGLTAIGLVLVYKGSRVFNFAQAEFGGIAAFILMVLTEQVKSPEIPYGVGVVIALFGALMTGLIMERIVVRPLLNAPRITVLVATIAFSLFLIGVEIMLFLPEAKSLQPLVQPFTADQQSRGIELFAYIVSPQDLIIFAVLVVLAALLGYFFSRTDLGLAVLATSQDAFATRVVGIGVERMSRFIWGAAALLGGIAGILFVPTTGALAPGSVTSAVLIPAFIGAVIGGMTSLPGAFVGGLSIGIIKQLAEWAGGNPSYMVGEKLLQDVIPGFSSVALVVTLLIVLLIRPQGLLGSEA